jgi:outer membrane protein OmpA-like peptidoglycan-associated protein
MMKTIKFLFVAFTLLVMQGVVQAQLSQGNKAYDRMAFKQAAGYYEQALKKDSSDMAVWGKLGVCYRNLNDARNAERAYGKVVGSGVSNSNEHYFYILALMQNQKYTVAKEQAQKFKSAYAGDPRVSQLENSMSRLDDYLIKQGTYTVKSINRNTGASDICAVPYKEGIVFVSDRGVIGNKKMVTSSTDRPFYSPYYAKGTGASFDPASAFPTYMRSDYHAGPMSFKADGSVMIITRSSASEGKPAKDDNGMVSLQLFSSIMGESGWGLEVAMPFNSANYSCAHPSLSADGNTLYFSSDMPGGSGGMDIWKSIWNGNTWSTPENLGNRINSPGNDVYPFITTEGILYYASNGLPGLGGLDVYMAENMKGSWGNPENLGADINSSDDDFAFTFNNESKTGYFTSNRSGQGLNDDLYFYEKLCTNTNISVLDEETGKPLSGVSVRIVENGEDLGNILTDDTGVISRCLNASRNYEFIATRDKYKEARTTLSSGQLAASSGSASVSLKLKRIPDSVAHVEGRVFNADDKSAAPNLTVSLVNKKSGETKTATTDAAGKYRFEKIDIDVDYEVRTKKTDCGEPVEAFNTKGIVGTKTITMDIPLLCKNDVIEIENIYYDYKKFDIRPDAALELDKIVVILNKYPNMRIELRSHTDSRGNDNFNLKLSDDRANSAALYIIGKGIDSKRIVAKGYGEKELLNKCKNGVKCDEKEHEVNRRTEFKILSL